MYKKLIWGMVISVLTFIPNHGFSQDTEYPVISAETMAQVQIFFIAGFPSDQLPDKMKEILGTVFPGKGDNDEDRRLVLIGLDAQGKYHQICELPHEGLLSLVKNIGEYRNGKIIIDSQAPNTALTNTLVYDWQNGRATLESSGEGDDQGDDLKKAEKMISRGEFAAAMDIYGGMLYPGRYFNEWEVNVKIMKSAHRLAMNYYKQKKVKDAVEIMEKGYKSLFSENSEDFKQLDRARLEAGKYIKYLSWKDYLEIQNDYGFFLQQAGDDKKAIEILNNIIKNCPEREVAYLNLADAYEDMGEKESAKINYRKYVEQMEKSGKKSKIPKRALERLD